MRHIIVIIIITILMFGCITPDHIPQKNYMGLSYVKAAEQQQKIRARRQAQRGIKKYKPKHYSNFFERFYASN